MLFQPALKLEGTLLRPACEVPFHPLTRHSFKRVRQGALLRLARRGRIYAFRDLLADLVAPLAGALQRNLGIDAELERPLFAIHIELDAPPPRAVGLNEQIQPVGISQFDRLCPRLGRADYCVVERHIWRG